MTLFAGKVGLVVDPVIPTIHVVNKSKSLSDEDFRDIVEACKIQLDAHVAPMWGRTSWQITSGTCEDSPGYPIVIMDDADQAGSLGYHTQTPDGKIWGRVFVDSILKCSGSMMSNGWLSVSSILSHEIIETFIDPDINMWANMSQNVLVAYEVCDPVEMDTYEIVASSGKPVCVSNFVLPTWFNPTSDPNDKFDYMSRVTAPLKMTRGGYMVIHNSMTCETKTAYGPETSEIRRKLRQDPHPAARSIRKIFSKSGV